MAVFVCRHCRFRVNSSQAKECPYCGRNTLEKEKSAEELLDEVEDLLNE